MPPGRRVSAKLDRNGEYSIGSIEGWPVSHGYAYRALDCASGKPRWTVRLPVPKGASAKLKAYTFLARKVMQKQVDALGVPEMAVPAPPTPPVQESTPQRISASALLGGKAYESYISANQVLQLKLADLNSKDLNARAIVDDARTVAEVALKAMKSTHAKLMDAISVAFISAPNSVSISTSSVAKLSPYLEWQMAGFDASGYVGFR